MNDMGRAASDPARPFSHVTTGNDNSKKQYSLTSGDIKTAILAFILPHFGIIDCITWIYIASWIAAASAFPVKFIIKIRRLLRENTPEHAAADSI